MPESYTVPHRVCRTYAVWLEYGLWISAVMY
jgi:hypothetical protein